MDTASEKKTNRMISNCLNEREILQRFFGVIVVRDGINIINVTVHTTKYVFNDAIAEETVLRIKINNNNLMH